MRPRVLVIVGPTASGKSDLAVKLAKKLNGEVISADSRQVYKGLDHGTGKIIKKEMRGVPHHLLDVVSPEKVFSASDYKKLALKKIEEILKRDRLPIIVGGTGFYIDALMLDLPEVAPNQKLRKSLENMSLEELSKMLGEHNVSDRKNKVRLIRAIEIVEALGHIPPLCKSSEGQTYEFVFVGIKPRDLEKRIEKRLDKRMLGMIREVKSLNKKGLSWKRMNELGLEYRYLSRYVRGIMNKEEMRRELLKEIKNYAKRQMTWFKKNEKTTWFESPDDPSLLEATQELLES